MKDSAWQAIISIEGEIKPTAHATSSSREEVVAFALRYAETDEQREDLAKQLALEPHLLWLFPARVAHSGDMQIEVTWADGGEV